MSPASTLFWSAAQTRAAAQLREYAELFLFGDWHQWPGHFRPRLMPLLIGPSGLGKTHVIREGVARELELPYLRLTSSGWIIVGAKEEPTMLRVQDFVSEHDRGIIHIDELDKFSLSSDWSKFLIGEMFDLLDRSPAHPARNAAWGEENLLKLKYDFWIVATGTWQDLWTQAGRAKVGFGAAQSEEALLENVRRLITTTNVIPAELLRRFNQSELLFLPPATEKDFQNAAENNGIAYLARALNETLDFAAAVQSSLGARWLEETLGRLMLRARRENRLDLIPLRSRTCTNAKAVEQDDNPNALPPLEDLGFDSIKSVL